MKKLGADVYDELTEVSDGRGRRDRHNVLRRERKVLYNCKVSFSYMETASWWFPAGARWEDRAGNKERYARHIYCSYALSGRFE